MTGFRTILYGRAVFSLVLALVSFAGVAATATPPSRHELEAAADLARFAGEVGLEFVPVTLERGKDVLPQRVVDTLARARSDESFALAVVRDGTGRRAFLAGKTPVAVRYAAVAFLEDYCGVRFFHAGPGGTVAPAKPVCSAPDGLLDVREPCVSYRRLLFRRESVEPNIPLEDYRTWMVRRGYQLRPEERSTQTAFDRVVPLSLFGTHPEYFPLVGGRRSLEAAKRSNRRCFTNPDVLRLVSDDIVDHCLHDNAFILSQACETGDWCECDACRKWGLGDDGKWRVQNLVHRFGAEISRRALAKMPEARICAQAYRDWRFPPTASDIVYDPRVAVDYCPICRCYAHPLTAPCNDRFRRDYENWRRHAPRLGTFGWSSVSGMRYSPIARVFAADFPWLLDHGFDAWLEACSTPVEKLSTAIGNWRLFYVASRMMWNPGLDVEKLLDETDRLYYGAAYAPMHAYQNLRQKVWDAAEGHAVANAPCRCFGCLDAPGAEDELLSLLDQGERLAAGVAELQARIAIDRRGLEQYWIAGHREKMRKIAARAALPREDREIRYARTAGSSEGTDAFPSEKVWAATPARSFYLKGRKAPAEGTTVRLVADASNWFVRIEANYDGEPMCKAIERDGEVWKDDAIEIFVKPPEGEYAQVIVNAKGEIFDTLGVGGEAFDYGGEVRQAWRDTTLVTDVRLPVAPIAGAGKGTDGTWQFRFARDNPRKNEWSGLGDEWRDGVEVAPARALSTVQ